MTTERLLPPTGPMVVCKMLVLSFDNHILLVFAPKLRYLFISILVTESSPRTSGASLGDEWRSAFDAAANGPVDSSRHSRRNSDPPQNGDASSGANSGSRRTPTRLPPVPPQGGSSYRY